MTAGCCRCWITTGAVLLGLGIIAGAYGAHGLDEQLMKVHGNKPPVERLGSSITAASKALDDFRTGVRYHVWHALGLIAVGLVGSLPGTRRWPLHRIRLWPGYRGLFRCAVRPDRHWQFCRRRTRSGGRHIGHCRLVSTGCRGLSLWQLQPIRLILRGQTRIKLNLAIDRK